MGLDTTHGAWHGSYSGFANFRRAVCLAAGLGDIDDYEGFGGNKPFPHRIDVPVTPLLDHSDCDGEIKGEAVLLGIADYLDMLVDEKRLPTVWHPAARRFAAGCRAANDAGEPLEFH